MFKKKLERPFGFMLQERKSDQKDQSADVLGAISLLTKPSVITSRNSLSAFMGQVYWSACFTLNCVVHEQLRHVLLASTGNWALLANLVTYKYDVRDEA